MRKFGLKLATMFLTLAVSASLLSGCGASNQNANNSSSKSNKSQSETVSGSITATGSTALQPLVEQASKLFTDKNPDATINVQGGGSGTGLKDSAAGNADIGNSDIFAEEKLPADQAKTLVDHKVCVVGFAVVTNQDINVDNLTKQQVIDIFTGKIKSWKEVGGNDEKITIINRPQTSGTRATFKKYALDGKDEAVGVALIEDSSGAVQKTVKATKGAISYLASSFLFNADNKQGLKVLKYDGVEMTKENITTGKYPIWSYEHMYTKGQPKGLTRTFLDFMTGSDMKSVINKLGYIPNSDMKTSR